MRVSCMKRPLTLVRIVSVGENILCPLPEHLGPYAYVSLMRSATIFRPLMEDFISYRIFTRLYTLNKAWR